MKHTNSLKQWGFMLACLVSFFSWQNASAQCGGDINFSTGWTNYGANQNCTTCDYGGVWQVSDAGKTVSQTVNGGATFYVSDKNFIDVTIHGTFRVNTATDDDWVGFVFGYKDPMDNINKRQNFYLFDWKQLQQDAVSTPDGKKYGVAKEGFCLMKINDSIDFTKITTTGADNINFVKTYWAHRDDRPEVTRLDSLYGSDKGWPENTDIDFSLTYTTKKIIITIDNDTIFNEDGCFEPGKFGFYNLSQSSSEYKNFSYSLIPDFSTDIPDGCINTPIAFNAVNNACQDVENYESPIKTWKWDFKDGQIASGNNVNHSYSIPGFYDVVLTVGDGGTCSTSVAKTFEVKGLVLSASKDYLCASDQVILKATSIPSATYTWYKDGSPIQTTTVDSLAISDTGSYKVVISGAGTYSCNTASNEVTIANGIPDISITAADTVICSGVSIALTASPYTDATYQWYVDGSVSSDPSNAAGNVLTASLAGNYTVLVTTTNGCSAVSTAKAITSGVNPVVTLSSPATSFCPYDSIQIQASSPGNTVTWYRNSQILTATGTTLYASSAGTYNVIAENVKGCRTTSSNVVLTVKSLPKVSITSSKPGICPASSVTLTVKETGGVYSWMKDGSILIGEKAQTLMVSDPGNVLAIVTGVNGCVDTSASFPVVSYANPTAAFTAPSGSFCSNASLTLTATEVTGGTYAWFINGVQKKSGTSKTYTLTDAGDVLLKVTQNGCQDSTSAQSFTKLTAPDVSFTSSITSLCSGSTGLLAVKSSDAANFAWYKDGSLQKEGIGANTLSVSTAGSYYVSVDNGNCSATSSTIKVTEKSGPPALDAIYGGGSEYCPGEDFQFSVYSETGVTKYIWAVSPASAASIGAGQGTKDVNISFKTPTGSVTISCTPWNECAAGTSVTQIVKPSPFLCYDPIQFIADKTSICKGSSVTFNALTAPNFGSHYRWDFGSGSGVSSVTGNSATVTFNNAGTFNVTIVVVDDFSGYDMNSLIKYDFINVEDATSAAAISGQTAVTCDGSYQYAVTNGETNGLYTWVVPSNATIVAGQNSDALTVYFTAGGSGNIQATLKNGSSCAANPADLPVTASCIPLFINNSIPTLGNISIYPNPATNYLQFKGLQSTENLSVKITNELGETVLHQSITGDQVSVRDLPSGVYFIEITGQDKKTNMLKFLKK